MPSLFIGLWGFLFVLIWPCSFCQLMLVNKKYTEFYLCMFQRQFFPELIYIFMACCGFICLFKTKFYTMLRSAISLGLVFTLIVLISGAIWGKPTWGTYWVWEGIFTFILLIQYIGLLAYEHHSIRCRLLIRF